MRRGIIITTVLALAIVFGTVDYKRTKNNQKPIFSLPLCYLKDGGTVEYIGLLYSVRIYHRGHISVGLRLGPEFRILYMPVLSLDNSYYVKGNDDTENNSNDTKKPNDRSQRK